MTGWSRLATGLDLTWEQSMTDEQFYQIVRSYGLRPTPHPTVWEHVRSRQLVNVQDPRSLAEDALKEAFLRNLKRLVDDLQ